MRVFTFCYFKTSSPTFLCVSILPCLHDEKKLKNSIFSGKTLSALSIFSLTLPLLPAITFWNDFLRCWPWGEGRGRYQFEASKVVEMCKDGQNENCSRKPQAARIGKCQTSSLLTNWIYFTSLGWNMKRSVSKFFETLLGHNQPRRKFLQVFLFFFIF